MKPEELVWVVNGPQDLKIPKAARTKIRRQVMKAAMEVRRQQQRRDGPSESRTHNVEDEDQGSRSERTTRAVGGTMGKLVVRQPAKIRGQHLGCHNVLPLSLPPTGIEVLIIDHGLDRQTAVSMLGCINLETLASGYLNSHRDILPLMTSQDANDVRGYFGHVGRAYGHLSYLDDALNALVGRVKANLSPQSGPSEVEVMKSYGRALRSLQAVIESESWQRPEVLSATQLLALFELLSSKGLHSWRRHIQGAARLMQARGPTQFETDFDVDLFLNLYPALTCESFISCQRCFLEGDEWKDFVQRITDHDRPFSARGSLALSSAYGLIRLIGLIPRVHAVLQAKPDPDAPEVRELAAGIRQEVQAALAWRRDFASALKKLAEEDRDIRTNHQLQNVYGTGVMWHMCSCRLLASVLPADRHQLERTAQSKARELVNLIAGVKPEDYRQRLLLMQKLSMAEAVLVTAHEWEDRGRSFYGKLVDVSVFLRFCQIITDSAQCVTKGAPVLKVQGSRGLCFEEEPGDGDSDSEGDDEEDASMMGLTKAFKYWQWSKSDFYIALYE